MLELAPRLRGGRLLWSVRGRLPGGPWHGDARLASPCHHRYHRLPYRSSRRTPLALRPPAFAGAGYCSTEVFAYHSCKNRSCPKCHTEQTQAWLDRRTAEMLPAPYFHVTITVPEELRPALRSNQRDGYSLLIKTTAEAIIELARDRRFVGGTVGVLAVLHTWTQQLHYHPHVHRLVTGGGVSTDSRSWWPAARKAYLF